MDFLSQTACVEEQPDDFCKIFNDPIHGHVSVPGAIVQFIDTPQVRSFIATLIRREHTLQLCSRSPHVVYPCILILILFSLVPAAARAEAARDDVPRLPRCSAQPLRALAGCLLSRRLARGSLSARPARARDHCARPLLSSSRRLVPRYWARPV